MSWDRIRGHDAVRQRFVQSLSAGRLGQAYLFVGPAGVGKKLFAMELAKALLCEKQSNEFFACDSCASCKLVDAHTHPDLTISQKLEDKTELTVEVIRELLGHVGMKSTRGKRKVVILDDVDFINDEAANMFLKTLEEPPAGSLLILLATSIESQLPTILSRCQVVRFLPLSKDDVLAILKSNGVNDAEQADRVARLADGSPGTALELIDPEVWAFRETLLSGVSEVSVKATRLIEPWLKYIEEAGKENIAKRRRASQTLKMLIDFLRRAVRLEVGSHSAGLTGLDHERALAIGKKLGPDGLLALIEACEQADDRIDRLVPVPIIVESVADRFAKKTSY